jgi:histidinol-phosphatase (PHP family)
MSRLPDYHMHTARCKHARGSLMEYVQTAAELGIYEIAFTDHGPLPDGYDLAHRMGPDETEAYVQEVIDLRRQFPEMKILLGIEADYLPEYTRFLDDFLKSYPFDLVLMSVHFIEGWSAGNWVFEYHFDSRTQQDIYREYLSVVRQGIETGLFDVVAHLDLIKRPGTPLLPLVQNELLLIFEALKAQNMALEINTSGTRKAIAEPYPARPLAELAVKNGVALTFGSDAHAPEQVGLFWTETENWFFGLPKPVRAEFNQRRMRVIKEETKHVRLG